MGRWRSRHERPSHQERVRLGTQARSLFVQIACDRSWLPFWTYDNLDYKECLVFPGNPGLSMMLTLSFSINAVTFEFEPGETEWFPVDEDGLSRFCAALDAAVQSQGGQAPASQE